MLYNILTALALIIASPVILALSVVKKKFRRSLKARFFLWRNPPFATPQKWLFHACSLGEVNAVLPFVKALGGVLTTTTATGFDAARRAGVEVRFLPFEPLLWWWLPRVERLVVFEAELWRNLFAAAQKNGAQTILLNARISTRSLPRYRRFAWFYARLFAHVDAVLAQSSEDAARLEMLGARRVRVLGNVKSALVARPTRTLAKNFARVVVLASTHAGEEARLCEQIARVGLPADAQIVVVPRHPERFAEVDAALRAWAAGLGRSYARMSGDEGGAANSNLGEKSNLGENDGKSNLILSKNGGKSNLILGENGGKSNLNLDKNTINSNLSEKSNLDENDGKSNLILSKNGGNSNLSEKLNLGENGENSNLNSNANAAQTPSALAAQVVLCDKIGELVNLYAIADVVALGGSFEAGIGGHNPLEAAQFGCAIVSGAHYFNQMPLYASVAGICVCDYAGFGERVAAFFAGAEGAPPRTTIKNRCDFDAVLAALRADYSGAAGGNG